MQYQNVVIDLSHHNNPSSFHEAAASGIKACIHKATQGKSYTDPRYKDNRARCAVVGIRWGAYHFGTGSGTGRDQADFFLEKATPKKGDLLVLDIEANPGGQSMSRAQGEAFVQRIHEQTGVWPGVYYGSYLKGLMGNQISTILGNCWCWIARYGAVPTPQKSWDRMTMWQYTDGASGAQPHSVPGIGHCDRDRFVGTMAEFDAFWAANSLSQDWA